MRKGKDSLIFLLVVGVLIACVSMAKGDDDTAKAENSTEIVYPDYYAKTSNNIDTINDTESKDTKTRSEEAAESKTDEYQADDTIQEPVIPLADSAASQITQEPVKVNTATVNRQPASAKRTSSHKNTVSASRGNRTSSLAASVLDRKSQILSDMAQSTAVTNAVQTLANSVVTVKTVKYQAIANTVAVTAANRQIQSREAARDLVKAKQKADAERTNRIIQTASNTTKDALNTANTIHNNINQDSDKLHENVKDTLEQIKNLIGTLPELPDIPELPN